MRNKQNMSIGGVWLSGYELHAPGWWQRDFPGTAAPVDIGLADMFLAKRMNGRLEGILYQHETIH